MAGAPVTLDCEDEEVFLLKTRGRLDANTKTFHESQDLL